MTSQKRGYGRKEKALSLRTFKDIFLLLFEQGTLYFILYQALKIIAGTDCTNHLKLYPFPLTPSPPGSNTGESKHN